MNVYARFDEIPSMTLNDFKETKRYGWMDARRGGHENSIPTHKLLPTNKHSLGGGGYNYHAEDILLIQRVYTGWHFIKALQSDGEILSHIPLSERSKNP